MSVRHFVHGLTGTQQEDDTKKYVSTALLSFIKMDKKLIVINI